MMKFDRQKFIEDLKVLATLNIPFVHQGFDPRVGFDCIHVLRYAYERQKPLPADLALEFNAYHDRPDGVHMIAVLRKWFQEVPIPEAQPADILLFYGRKNPQHVAALVSESEIVEAYRSDDRSVKRVLQQPLDPRRRIAAAFRIPDFA